MTRSGLTWIALASAAAGVMAALHYAALDLTLSHYDAKAHLVVARRVADSLTPGWKQFGGVWLPLPHVLNTWPVQVDSWYRTGLSGAVISVLGFVLAATALAALTWRLSGSRLAAATAWAVFAGNPNVLYLQSTPMTEALLFGLLAASALAVTAWAAPGSRVSATWPGVALALAVLTRYEAWPVAPALLVAAWMARARADGATAHAWRTSLARVIGLAVDSAAIAGPGTAGQPTGITATSGVGTANPATGTAVTYADMIRFQTVVAGSNAFMPGFAYVTTPTVAGFLMAKSRFTNSDTPIWGGNILDGALVGARAMSTLQVGSGTMLAGDFSQVVVGEWGVLEIEANPYAQFQSGIVGVRALYTCDVGVRYGPAFALGTGLVS